MLFGYGGGREPSVGAENECLPSPRVCAASARGEGKGEGPASREEPLPLRFAPPPGASPPLTLTLSPSRTTGRGQTILSDRLSMPCPHFPAPFSWRCLRIPTRPLSDPDLRSSV